MNRRCLILLLVIILLACNSFAKVEFGVNGLVGRSDNSYMNNPNGWSMFFSKSISEKMSIRATVARFDKDMRFFGEMVFGFPPQGNVAVQELIQSNGSASMYEFSLHHMIVEGNKMRLEVGAGIGGTNFKLDLNGLETGSTMSIDHNPSLFMYSFSVVVNDIFFPHLNARLGYQFRKMWGATTSTDSFEPFHDVTISGLTIGLSASW